jgi:hypothetical protein
VSESAVVVGPEWRVFDEREKRRVRTAPLKLVVKTDMAVRLEHGVQWQVGEATQKHSTQPGEEAG